MAGLRIEGTPEEIEEAVRRIKKVFYTNNPSKFYPGRDGQSSLCYLRIYSYPGSDTLYEELEAATNYISELEARLGEAGRTIAQLEEELEMLAKPRVYDVVLGNGNGKTAN